MELQRYAKSLIFLGSIVCFGGQQKLFGEIAVSNNNTPPPHKTARQESPKGEMEWRKRIKAKVEEWEKEVKAYQDCVKAREKAKKDCQDKFVVAKFKYDKEIINDITNAFKAELQLRSRKEARPEDLKKITNKVSNILDKHRDGMASDIDTVIDQQLEISVSDTRA